MSEIVGAIIGAAAVIAVPIIANIIQLRAINKHLGFGEDEESMKRQLDSKLGVEKEDVSIAYQNRRILTELTAYKAEQEKKAKSFTKKQKDTKQKVEEIADFLKDWERLNLENQELKDKVLSLQERIAYCERVMDESIKQNQKLHSEKEELKRTLQLLEECSTSSEQENEDDWSAEE